MGRQWSDIGLRSLTEASRFEKCSVVTLHFRLTFELLNLFRLSETIHFVSHVWWLSCETNSFVSHLPGGVRQFLVICLTPFQLGASCDGKAFCEVFSVGRGRRMRASAQPQAASPSPGRFLITVRPGSTVCQRIGRDGRPIGGPASLEILHFDPDDIGVWADIP